MTKSEDSNLASLDLVIDEILDRLRTGEPPSLNDFVNRYPENASAIRDVFPALMMAEQIKQDSLAGNSSLNSPPPIRSTEHNLLLGVLALQCGLINREQFLSSFENWNNDRSRSYQSVLLSKNLIKNEACELLNLLADQQLAGKATADESPLGVEQTHVFMGGTNSNSHDGETGFSLSEGATASNRFEFIRPLDQGGLGIVSVALDKELNREVALKEIREDRADDSQLRERFWLEAQLTGGLEHPGIIPIYGLGKSAKGKLYYAMRLIKGNNLHLHIKSFHEKVKLGKTEFDGQSLRRILRRFLDICEAISYAHSRGVLHRDLKPGNIMLGPYGETLVVDWGLAKAMGISAATEPRVIQDVSVVAEPEIPIRKSGTKSDSTRDGSIVGTPSYAPPEQLSGHLDLIEVRSDVYGLGAILYEILCGQAPASGTLLEVVRTVTTGKVPPVRSVYAQVPKTLEAICSKAM
jgi:serine/threonine-protein kinase